MKLYPTLLSTLLLASPAILDAAAKKALVTYEGETVVVTPERTTNIVVNPGKGWVLFGNRRGQPAAAAAIASLGYARYAWGDIEPQEGLFRWDLIERDIQSWADQGRQYAFGVLCAASSRKDFWMTPQWVFDAGARYDTFELKDPRLPTVGAPGKKLVPIFDDPVFLKKLEHFVNALAARYDGDPRLAFVDIRSYGNWGEGHMFPFNKHEISAEQYKAHIEIHRRAFKKTRLVLPVGDKHRKDFEAIFDWAVSVGVALRRDGICGNSNGDEVARCAGKLPAVFELYADYGMLKSRGWWDGRKDQLGRGYRLRDCVEIGKPTWCDLSRGGPTASEFMNAEPELVRELAHRLGYHFVLREARYPKHLRSGQAAPVSLTWENRGVAYIFIPAKVTFALLTPKGRVVHMCDAIKSIPASWKPDAPVTVADEMTFPKAPAGDYRLAVGIRQPHDKGKPSIQLGTDLKCVDGWYELGPITIP